MKKRPLIAVAAIVGVLVALLIAAFAYDSSRKNTIAKGVTAGGIDIGGMSRAQATQLLEEKLSTPLEKPLVVQYGHRKFHLTARKAHLTTDVDGMVQQAIDKSRSGFFVGRAIRGVTGGSVNDDIPPQISFSAKSVRSLVRRVERKVDRDAQDASVQPTPGGLETVPSKLGIDIRGKKLIADVSAALIRPDGSRVVIAQGDLTKPKVSSAQLAAKFPSYIIVDRNNFQLRLFKNLKLAHTYTVAIGMAGLETPAGLYHIQDKQVNPSWHVPNSAWAGSLAGKVIPPGPADPIKARWMGFFNGAGIHGTDEIGSLGHNASHGCVRMAIPDVEALYDQVSVGTPVYVA
jgi:hypothetical protein